MQNHSRRGDKVTKRRDQSPQKKGFVEQLFDTFCHLSDPAQTVLVIGLLLLLAWLLANPLILAALIKAFLGLITIRATLKGL